MKQRILPPGYFFLLLLLAITSHFLFSSWTFIRPPYSYSGIVPVIFGIVLNLWTDSAFKNNSTTVKPFEKPSSFIVSGPFRISRHPMYLGMTSILLGVSLLLGSVISLMSLVIFVFLMEKLFISVEERNMEEIFGEQYLVYKRNVRRWI
ncbi:isoprenylcysteine carboxylmethyltransferase family protein [Methanolobus sp. ZRKC5]|uniref:methyltransferase family protein n=1 Tax=unclassified Methanolobus TaxID=2629569 RepID=UPI00313E1DB3